MIKTTDEIIDKRPKSFAINQNRELIKEMMIEYAKQIIEEIAVRAKLESKLTIEPYTISEPQSAIFREDINTRFNVCPESILEYMTKLE